MSFADLERNLARDTHINPDEDLAFSQLAKSLSTQIFRINANVSAVSKLVELLGGTKDTGELRTKLHNLTEVTRALIKDTTTDIKRLAAWQLNPDDRQHLLSQQKISTDFQASLKSFQAVQKRSAERQRSYVERAKEEQSFAASEQMGASPSDQGPLVELSSRPSSSGQQQQQQLQAESLDNAELDYQEQLITEREGEIREIEQGITELNDIFRDLGTIVHEQQSMLDNIESNVLSASTNTRGAEQELVEAHRYQRQRGRRMMCLLLIFIVVFVFILLAVLS